MSVFAFSPSKPLFQEALGQDQSDLRFLTKLALCVAGIAALSVSAHIKIPFYPVPLTMQTLFVLAIGMSYGSRLGATTLFGYLALGAAGAPVFAGGAGLAYFAGTTGGYLVGFIVAATIMGVLAERGWARHWATTAASMAIGTAIIYVLGAGWLSTIIGFEKALQFGVLPFLYGDALKLIIATAAMPMAWAFIGKPKA